MEEKDLLYYSVQVSYFIAAMLFVIGIKMMNTITGARKGNLISAVGMLVAIVATLIQIKLVTLPEILICMGIGAVVGSVWAYITKMTQMPEMVAMFHGFGGLASVFVGISDYYFRTIERGMPIDTISYVFTVISVVVGGITFTGSMVAFMKLSGLGISGKAVVFQGQHYLNLFLFILVIIISVFVGLGTQYSLLGIILWVTISFSLGVLLVIPIGGADMPVVISLLNSYSGIAVGMIGFVLNNVLLIVTGALVGSTGIILSRVMCKGMNRSLFHVLAGGFGIEEDNANEDSGNKRTISIKQVGTEEVAMMLDAASSVIIVPGYGMAVSQAQYAIREIVEQLEKRDIPVRFAIHPVAGRMPGHMNVLLAEANISYDKLFEMDLINDDFASTDIVIVIGANDVVNPAARTNHNSPIFGMPILNADKARTVIVSKRSMASGYSGIENELFGAENCLMLFGDAKATMTKIVAELKS